MQRIAYFRLPLVGQTQCNPQKLFGACAARANAGEICWLFFLALFFWNVRKLAKFTVDFFWLFCVCVSEECKKLRYYLAFFGYCFCFFLVLWKKVELFWVFIYQQTIARWSLIPMDSEGDTLHSEDSIRHFGHAIFTQNISMKSINEIAFEIASYAINRMRARFSLCAFYARQRLGHSPTLTLPLLPSLSSCCSIFSFLVFQLKFN